MSTSSRNPPCDPLTVVAEAGVLLLTSGAEVARVEDTMQRLSLAFDTPADAVVFPTVIFLSLPEGRTIMHRIRRRGTNLGVVAEVNQLSRQAAEGRLSLEAFREGLQVAAHFRRYPAYAEVLAAGGAAALLSQLFGGALPDVPWAFLAGAAAQSMRALARSYGFSGSLGDFVGALAAVLPALVAANLPGLHPGAVIVGGMMVLVPGLMMTTAVRDGIQGDLLSSAARLLEAVLVAAAVASGAALPLYMYIHLGGRWP